MSSLSQFATTKKTAAKNEKENHKMEGTLSAELHNYIEANKQIDHFTAIKAASESVLKGHGQHLMCDKMEKGRKVESFIMSNDKGESLLYIVQDRFRSIKDQETAEAIKAMLGADSVKTTEYFSFNPEVLARHQDKIAKAIMELNIPDEDKNILLVNTPKIEYTFGVDEIPAVAKKAGQTVETVFTLTQPVQQLKGQGK